MANCPMWQKCTSTQYREGTHEAWQRLSRQSEGDNNWPRVLEERAEGRLGEKGTEDGPSLITGTSVVDDSKGVTGLKEAVKGGPSSPPPERFPPSTTPFPGLSRQEGRLFSEASTPRGANVIANDALSLYRALATETERLRTRLVDAWFALSPEERALAKDPKC